MLHGPRHPPHLPATERSWKPVLLAGAAGPTDAIWLEGVLAIAAESIGVILLAILGGVIFLFNHFVFRSQALRQDERDDAREKGKRE